jgi:threonine aldolase
MERAWRVRRRLGGGMRQAGLLAAAGLYALRHNLARLADDHRTRRRWPPRAGALEGLDAAAPETNIVMIDLVDAGWPRPPARRAGGRGVRMTQFGPRRLRR